MCYNRNMNHTANILGKRCTLCNKTKETEEFSKDSYNKDGLNSRCRECMTQIVTRYRNRDRTHFNAIQRKNLKNRREKDRIEAGKSPLTIICECGEQKKSRASKRCADCIERNRRDSWLKRQFNISIDDYECLLITQFHSCAICKDKLQPGRYTHVDHDHTTGAVRGLLCNGCNIGLGYFQDSPARMAAAIEYLSN